VIPRDDCFQECFITQGQRWPTGDEIKDWEKSDDLPYSYVQENAPNPVKDELIRTKDEVRNLGENIRKLEAELASEESEYKKEARGLAKDKKVLEEQLAAAVEGTKTLEEEWDKERVDLIKNLVDQDEAIDAGIKMSCKTAGEFQSRWRKSSGISWILEGFKRLFRGG